jgi:hypothetical protein
MCEHWEKVAIVNGTGLVGFAFARRDGNTLLVKSRNVLMSDKVTDITGQQYTFEFILSDVKSGILKFVPEEYLSRG